MSLIQDYSFESSINSGCTAFTLTNQGPLVWAEYFDNIVEINLNVTKGCDCDDDAIATFELHPTLDSNLSITSIGTIVIDALDLDLGLAGDVMSDGIYEFEIIVTHLLDGGTQADYTYKVCSAALCSTKCCISKSLNTGCYPENKENILMNTVQGIEYSCSCGYCETACNLYDLLSETLDSNCEDCGC